MAYRRKDPREKAASYPHVRPVAPLPFASEDPEGHDKSQEHRHLRRALEEVLRAAVPLTKSTVGIGRPIYYRANDARHRVLPDGFVKHGIGNHPFSVWK